MINPRLQSILDLLYTRPEATVAEMAEEFDVTAMTIRRDLASLEEQGRINRTHGGAILAAPSVAQFMFHERQHAKLIQKQAIAQTAVKFIEPGMTVTLDTGTTTLEVAKALINIPNLKILTSSLAIASTLFAHEDMELVLLGGTVSRGSPDLSGPLTEENLAGFRSDLAFIGADGIDPRGLYTRSQAIASVTRAMVDGATKSVLVADSSKFGRNAFVRFTEWKKVDSVVVDDALSVANRRWLKKAAKQVLIAKV